jgi:hypothetical protein
MVPTSTGSDAHRHSADQEPELFGLVWLQDSDGADLGPAFIELDDRSE